LMYCSMMPYDEKGTRKLIKFSVFPEHYDPTSSRSPRQHQLSLLKGFTKELYYTKEDSKQPQDIYEADYRARLAQHQRLSYSMVYQEREDTELNRNAAFPWKETPYIPFGHFVISKTKVDDGTTAFDINQMPSSLYLPDASDAQDSRAIGHIRKTLYPNLQSIRKQLLSFKIF
jgi:hypothetical protein